MDMRSKRFFSNWILLLTLCLLAPPALAVRPNVLLITADDLGLQLGCYGDKLAETPNIDRLARESVQFQTAYVSQASCSPSRSTMFTGLYPHGNGQYGLANANVGFQVHEHLLDALLPNVLNQAGYRTGSVGKIHATNYGFRREGVEQNLPFDKAHEVIEFWRDGRKTSIPTPYYGHQHVEITLGHGGPLNGHYQQWLREK
jgi:arylsulfatase A-like enzyme